MFNAIASRHRLMFMKKITLMSLVALFSLTTSALANIEIYESSYGTANTTTVDDCINVRLETSHGSNGAGYYRTEVILMAQREGDEIDRPCTFKDINPDQGRFRVQLIQEKWNFNLVKWKVCKKTGWNRNRAGRATVTLSLEEVSAMPSCGDGFYRNRTTICEQLSVDANVREVCYDFNTGYHRFPA